jgi:hypothetical protein
MVARRPLTTYPSLAHVVASRGRKTCNQSSDGDFEAKKNRVPSSTAWLIATPNSAGRPEVVVRMDEFGRSTVTRPSR